MGSAKTIELKAITPRAANSFVAHHHYSGKFAPNSQLHIGVYFDGRLEGVMQFGPSMDKRKSLAIVPGTPWNGFLELNRLVFTDALPRNSESRALSIAIKMIRKYAPHVQWIISYADACQCGDGTIYRASGFVLTQIKKNQHLVVDPRDGEIKHKLTQVTGRDRAKTMQETRGRSKRIGDPLEGFQLRYIYFVDPAARKRLACDVIPFSEISRAGAGMYKGQRRGGAMQSPPDFQSGDGGSTPTSRLQSPEE